MPVHMQKEESDLEVGWGYKFSEPTPHRWHTFSNKDPEAAIITPNSTNNRGKVFKYTLWGTFCTETTNSGDQASTTSGMTFFLGRHIKMPIHSKDQNSSTTKVQLSKPMSLLESVTGEFLRGYLENHGTLKGSCITKTHSSMGDQSHNGAMELSEGCAGN